MLDQAQSKAHFSSRRQMSNNFGLFPLGFPLKLKKFKERMFVRVCMMRMYFMYSYSQFITRLHKPKRPPENN